METTTALPARTDTSRQAALRHAVRLEVLTVGWNVVEGLIAVTAALAAGSVALLGFGIDSFVECASGLVLLWRLGAERRGMEEEAVERLDRRAHRLVGASLFLLAAYVGLEALGSLWGRERPEPSVVGMALTAVSIVTMLWLARAKRRAAATLRSRALEADAFQTTACFWLSVITLGGIGLNALFGWWWADPAAALAMTWFIGQEGLEAWRGEACGCSGDALRVERAEEPASCGCASGACARPPTSAEEER
jgi:divalent metal cation (Fe/Co/Zn/Cd) transporter